MAQHLIHIGYPKAGSTFLQAWFERHPRLRYHPGGLGGFQDVYEVARPSKRVYDYYVTSSEALSMPQQSAGRLNLTYGGAEADTDERNYEAQASVCSILKSLYPSSRILLVTRGFKGMILSGYSQFVRMGGRLHLNEMCRQLTEHLHEESISFYDFDALIRLYREAFGEENLIILPYELLRDDQEGFLALLEEKLGLEHAEIKIGRLNPSLSPAELYWYPLISRFVSATASRLGTRGFRRFYGWYVSRTLDNRLRLVVKVLQRLRPGRKITEADLPEEVLSYLAGKALLLKDNPLYTPYAAEYLWDTEQARRP